MKPSMALEVMQSVLKGGNCPFLQGEIGIGKSATVLALVKILAKDSKIVRDKVTPEKNEFSFIGYRLPLYESLDFGGLPFIDKNGYQRRAFLENLPQESEGSGLIFFDEFSQADKSVQAIIAQLTDEKRIGDYIFPKNWKIVLAGNASTHRAVSSKLPSNVVSRITLIKFQHDHNDWINWAVKNDVHPDILGFIQYQPEWLNVFDPRICEAQPNPRSYVRLSDTLKTNPRQDLIQEIAECDIGETASIELSAFISLKNDIPDLNRIVEGEEVKLVDDIGLMYATVVALITVIKDADKRNLTNYFKNSLNYIKKFPTPEYGIFFVRTVTSIKEELIETQIYSKFKIEHQEIEF
tara:strand:+ start:2167 stop:3222 length:1056 start_codon:yes stop_codon:yes gene_type:complete